jgi:hypothetical protein
MADAPPAEKIDGAMNARIQQAHLDRLCLELAELLAAELAAGNEIFETGSGWPRPESVLVSLAKPFLTKPAPLPPGVVFREINDPHWWKAEYEHEPSGQMLICRF